MRVPSREVVWWVPALAAGTDAVLVVMSLRRMSGGVFYTVRSASSGRAPQEQPSLRLVARPAGRLPERGGRRRAVSSPLEEVAADARDQRRRGERRVAGDRVEDRQPRLRPVRAPV